MCSNEKNARKYTISPREKIFLEQGKFIQISGVSVRFLYVEPEVVKRIAAGLRISVSLDTQFGSAC